MLALPESLSACVCERDGRALSCIRTVLRELAKYLKSFEREPKQRQRGSFSFHLPRRTDVSGSFVAVVRKLARANASFRQVRPNQKKHKTNKSKIKEKQNENENAVYCLVVYGVWLAECSLFECVKSKIHNKYSIATKKRIVKNAKLFASTTSILRSSKHRRKA